MHTNLLILFWRRKISILLLVSSLILFGLWTWAYLDSKQTFSQTFIVSNNRKVLNTFRQKFYFLSPHILPNTHSSHIYRIYPVERIPLLRSHINTFTSCRNLFPKQIEYFDFNKIKINHHQRKKILMFSYVPTVWRILV